MKKLNPLAVVLPVLFIVLGTACNHKIKPVENPEKTLVLKFKQTTGTNGVAVAYNAEKKLYYALIAGNADYPLEVFDEKGNNVFAGKANFDARGMWWNNDKKALEVNGYAGYGVGMYKLNENGYPGGNPESLTKLSQQPDGQSVGAYDFKNKHILYYYDGELVKVKREDFSAAGKVKLALPVNTDYINETSVMYTGIKGKEVGVLDYENKKVYLFDIKTGKLTHTANLPSTAVTNSLFRVSFANGHIWLYDTGSRSWTGYKLF